ncbi:hypothetical protein CTI12_AA571750 [Artemisia annua]|uniref:Uncharacterized protein n=1 Tax=Artemisia annua TaxID=35608 RepID=A0A2U1KRU5_ARTAN|nr:hypothetical protein CTI12_AA571750 [Artemisia annua]
MAMEKAKIYLIYYSSNYEKFSRNKNRFICWWCISRYWFTVKCKQHVEPLKIQGRRINILGSITPRRGWNMKCSREDRLQQNLTNFFVTTIKQLNDRTAVASPNEYDTTLGEVETLFNQLRCLPDNRL